MEIINFGGKDGMCLKCHRDLSISEKRSGMPICSKCASGLVDIIKDVIHGDDIREFSHDVSNFTDFISSSSKLMGLDDIVVIQVCFNVYMDMVGTIGRRNPIVAKKIFKDAKRFIDIELERLEDSGEDELDGFDKDKEEDSFGKTIGRLNDLMSYYNVLDNKKYNIDHKKEESEDDESDGSEYDDKNKEESKIEDNEHREDNNKDCKKGSKRIKID